MTQKPLVETQPVTHGPVTEFELDVGIAYAKKQYDRDIERDLLRLIVNTVLKRRERNTILPFLTATVVREVIPLSNKEQAPKIDAYKGAAMKVMSGRSAVKRQNDARKRKAGIVVAPQPKPVRHPEDPDRKDQFLLFNYK